MAQKAASRGRIVPKRKKARAGWKRPVKILFASFFVIGTILFLGIAGLAALKLGEAQQRVKNLSAIFDIKSLESTKIVSADGVVLYESVKHYCKPVELQHIPKFVVNAVLAAEDKRFYTHNGVDEWAVGRQLVTNFKERRMEGGASTLTMQLAKRFFTSTDKTIDRKLDDMALAVQIERQLTKQQILETYLNSVYYGSGAYGIAAAAEVYFNKHLGQLTLAEAAMIARCVRRPGDQNPHTNLKLATQNRDVVLKIMRDEGMINAQEYQAALAETPKIAPVKDKSVTIKQAPYFVRYVMDEIRRMPEFKNVDIAEGGYRIETTLDTRVQKVSDREAKELVRNYHGSGVRTAAFLLTKRDGGIVAMTGGIDFEHRQFNAITQGARQPGSSFKPFVYSVAFDRGDLSPSSSISNETIHKRQPNGEWWTVEGNGATISVMSAITYSNNPAAVRALMLVGPDYFVGRARRLFGFTTELPAVNSLVLGSFAVRPIEMSRAYSVFQTKGNRVDPYGIVRIVNSDGTVIRNFTAGSNVHHTDISEQACWEIDDCMRSVVLRGTAAPSGVSAVRNARGKTGTTNDNRDAWFCGYTNSFIGVGWISGERFIDNKWVYPPMGSYVMGGTVTGRMWRSILLEAQDILGESSDTGERTTRERYIENEDATRRRRNEDPIPVDVGDEPGVGNGDEPVDDSTVTTTEDAGPRSNRKRPRNRPAPDQDPPTAPDTPVTLPDGPGGGLPDGPGE